MCGTLAHRFRTAAAADSDDDDEGEEEELVEVESTTGSVRGVGEVRETSIVDGEKRTV